ncbi:hypothetical protein DPMN_132261 [Dreissena polymorpha]|uniref:Uncharacterized protein n=1 Tax=Dreissena polymorpha TaxID=45954 RepID=A0A9D4JBX1_DREPO|nr:hypothetical protein DPMN_132261 [Dreissena polymorpha]
MLCKLLVLSLLVATVALTASAAPEKRYTCYTRCSSECPYGGWCDSNDDCRCLAYING